MLTATSVCVSELMHAKAREFVLRRMGGGVLSLEDGFAPWCAVPPKPYFWTASTPCTVEWPTNTHTHTP